MYKIFFAFLLITTTIIVFAQEPTDTIKYWKTDGNISLNFSEASFSNWVGGGKNSVSGVGLFLYNVSYTKDKNNWENTINLGYGLLKEGKDDLVKSEDKFEFNSKYGYQTNHKKWFYSAMFNFRTQFADGLLPETQEKISGLLAPAYLSFALGLDYSPSEKFSILFSPISGKTTIINKSGIDETAYGLEEGKKTRHEFGLSLKNELKTELVKNVVLISKLSLFSNYLDNPQYIDVNWDLIVNMKINDFLSANLISNLIYDHDILIPQDDGSESRKIQLKQLFGVGLSYKF